MLCIKIITFYMKINFSKNFQNQFFTYCLLTAIFWLLLSFIEYPLRKIFHDYSISPYHEMIVLYLLIVFGGLFICYFLIYDWGRKNDKELKNNFKTIIFFFIAFQIILLIIPPIGSSDIYNYIFRTKVLTVYHENPYLVPAGNFPNDPLADYAQAGGGQTPLTYGPLWLGLALIPTILAKGTVFWGAFSFKLLAIILSSATCYLIFKILKQMKPDYQYLGTLLYAFNPLLLFEIANNGHNDIAMMFLVILSTYYFIENRFYLSFIGLTLAVLVKYIALILIPILFLFILNGLSTKKEKIKFAFFSLFIFSSLIILSYFLTGGTILIGKGVKAIADIFCPLFLPPLSFVIYLFSTTFDLKTSKIIVKFLTNFLFMVIYIYLLIKIIKQKNKESFDLIIFYSTAILGFLILAVSQLMPWYLIWFFPLAILIRKYIKLIIFLTVFMLICAYIFLYFLGYFFLLSYIIFYIIVVNPHTQKAPPFMAGCEGK